MSAARLWCIAEKGAEDHSEAEMNTQKDMRDKVDEIWDDLAEAGPNFASLYYG
jgi:hypothetical protein